VTRLTRPRAVGLTADVPDAQLDTSPAAGLLQIGEVADRVGLSLRTVRYYEEQGLLTPESRTAGGFRLYSETQVDRLALIKQMKPIGFTVQEMRELLASRDTARDPGARAAERRAARDQLAAYATSAAERCDKLRRQLQQAEGLADQLRAESGATGRPAAA
jgi:MerR family copper efflux transcriptional regulator